jgi:PAS domain S-box-containing protein
MTPTSSGNIKRPAVKTSAANRSAGLGEASEQTPLKNGDLQNAIFNSVNFSSIATDARGVIQIFNVGAERMLGYAAAEVVDSLTPADISDPDEVIARALALSLELATPISPGFEALVFKASRGIEDIYQLTYVRKDGSRFPAVVSVTALRDDQGAIIGYLLIGTDNTARKQLEASKALLDQRLSDRLIASKRANEQADKIKGQLVALVVSSADAIMSKNLDGIVTSWNPAAERLFGYSAEDMIGQAMAVLIPSDLIGEEADILAKIRDGQNVGHFETVRRRKNGTLLPVSVTISPIKDSAGLIIGASKIARDITDQKAAEAELLQHRDHLEGLVFSAARDVTESKKIEIALLRVRADLESQVHLRTAELESSNQELEAFAYSVSHDLRAPLRAIDGFSRKVVANFSDKLGAEGCRQLQVVRDNAQKMGALIDDLLAFSGIGRRDIAPQLLDMDNMVQGVVDELRALDPQRTIAFTIAPLPNIWGDAAMLRQVWVNLLTNAIKFTRLCPLAHVDISGRIEGGEAVYAVKDNGAGFDMRYAEKLFGVFQRLHRQDEFEGTGVGLAIAQRILHRHDGRIWGEGKPDAGASFSFALPLPSPEPLS